MADVIVQIYGIRTKEDADMTILYGANHIGVSYGQIQHTPGQLSCKQAQEIFEHTQGRVVRIGLTCAEDINEISGDLDLAMPDVLHLSGDIDGISPNEVMELRRRYPRLQIMQAIPVILDNADAKTIALDYVRKYEDVTDYFLIDTKAPHTSDIGATGKVHSWEVDKAIVESTKVKCIIAGGLDADNVADAIRMVHPYGVDSFSLTNYSDSRAAGLHCKDPQKVKAFAEVAKNA